jgi:hypothetical protein
VIGVSYVAECIMQGAGLVQGLLPILLLRLVCTAGAVGGLFAFGFFSDRERAFLREVIQRFRPR